MIRARERAVHEKDEIDELVSVVFRARFKRMTVIGKPKTCDEKKALGTISGNQEESSISERRKKTKETTITCVTDLLVSRSQTETQKKEEEAMR
jgi:hypothetical protein